MKGWVKKESAIASTHSLGVIGWLETFNVWVPCTIELTRRRTHSPDKVLVEFMPPPPRNRFKLEVPAAGVVFEHKSLRHSLPFLCYPLLVQLLQELKEWSKSEHA